MRHYSDDDVTKALAFLIKASGKMRISHFAFVTGRRGVQWYSSNEKWYISVRFKNDEDHRMDI